MTYFKNIWSKKILLLAGVLYLLDYITEGRLTDILILQPASTVDSFEFWRVFTYPLAYGSIEAVLLMAFIFYFISPSLESYLRKGIFPLFIFLLAFLHGIVHTIAFWKSPVYLAGFEGISIFILSLISFLNPRQKVSVKFLPNLKVWIMNLFVLTIWAFIKYFRFSPGNEEILIQSASTAGFGLVAGGITFLQFLVIKRIISGRKKISGIEIPQPEELKMAVLSQGKPDKYDTSAIDEMVFFEGDPESDEKKLNDILDKINEKGKESLSPEEIRFLKEYSSNL